MKKKFLHEDAHDIILAIMLMLAIGICIHSYYSCSRQLEKTKELRENQIQNYKID